MELQYLISGQFRVSRLIGRGTFGDVYQGIDEHSLKDVAIKTEELAHSRPQILEEGRILRDLQHIDGVPKCYWSGATHSHNVLVMELLGPSLEDLLTLCGRSMSTSSVLQLADQMLHRVEAVHVAGYIHRDIKPENYLMGRAPRDSVLYMIDFGLAKRWKEEGAHMPFREGKGLMGTARYASINSHLGMELSRRDDLEAILYTLVYLAKGRLPWQGLDKQSKDAKHSLILQLKQQTSIDALCSGLPIEFVQLMTYVRGLSFGEKPDYVYLKRLVRTMMAKRNVKVDRHFEWRKRLNESMRSYSASQLMKPRRAKTRLRTTHDVQKSKTIKPRTADHSTDGSDTKVKAGCLPAFTPQTREAITRFRTQHERRRCALW